MAKFELALQLVLANEGGFVDDVNDQGGATNLGISLRFYKKKVNPNATIDDIRYLTVNDAAALYKTYFWDRAPFDEIENQKIANRVFDLSVNVGAAHAIGILQKAVNGCIGSHLVIDGMLGAKTLAAVNSIPEENLYSSLIDQAQIYYKQIVENHPQDLEFYQGWINRLHN